MIDSHMHRRVKLDFSGQGSYAKPGSIGAVLSFCWSPEEMPLFPSQHISVFHHKKRDRKGNRGGSGLNLTH